MQKLFVANLLFIIMTLLVRSGESLKCYVCRTDQTRDCEEPEGDALAQVCTPSSGQSVYCRKISQKLRFKNNQNFTSIRTCAYGKGKYDCYNFKWLELAYQTTCECDTDLCNRALLRAPSPPLLLLPFSLPLLLLLSPSLPSLSSLSSLPSPITPR